MDKNQMDIIKEYMRTLGQQGGKKVNAHRSKEERIRIGKLGGRPRKKGGENV